MIPTSDDFCLVFKDLALSIQIQSKERAVCVAYLLREVCGSSSISISLQDVSLAPSFYGYGVQAQRGSVTCPRLHSREETWNKICLILSHSNHELKDGSL